MRDDRLELFLKGCEEQLSPDLERIRICALKEHVPVAESGTLRILKGLLALTDAGSVLEIGTAVGFSAIFMCSCSRADVTTIENFPPRIERARENIRMCGMEKRIRIIEGGAEEELPKLAGPFDLIFLDAAQGQYIRFLPELKRLLAEGGVLVTDNVLKGGEILESRYAVERRMRTIHRRMRMYLEELMRDPELTSTVLPVGDGVAVSVKGRPDF